VFLRGVVSVSAAGFGLAVFEQLSRFFTCEPPVDLRPFPVGRAIPGLGFLLQLRQIRDPARAQTLPRVHAEFDLRLVEPASVFGSVMDLQPIPKIAALFLAEVAGQRLAAMDIQVIHDEVNRLGEGVLLNNLPHHAGELGGATVGCRRGEVPTGLRLDNGKYVRHAAPFILVVLLGRLAWFSRYRRAHLGVQRNRFLIQTNDGLGRIVGLLIDGQHVFHLLDVFLVQLRHAPHFFPATASTRGFAARPGLSLVPHPGPVYV